MWRITFWSYEAPQLRVDTLHMETSRKHLPFTTPSPVLPWDWPIQSPGMNRPHPPLEWQHLGDLKRFYPIAITCGPINRNLSCSNALLCSQNVSDVLGLAAWPSSQNLALDILRPPLQSSQRSGPAVSSVPPVFCSNVPSSPGQLDGKMVIGKSWEITPVRTFCPRMAKSAKIDGPSILASNCFALQTHAENWEKWVDEGCDTTMR